MKKLLIAALALSCSAAFAADPAPAKNSQQSKMATFMKECLSAKPAAPVTQQDKMKTCNADAAGKKGDERKAFMKECLSSKKAA
jgi:photosystem II stability/assembly factor-like uncharacterized protein